MQNLPELKTTIMYKNKILDVTYSITPTKDKFYLVGISEIELKRISKKLLDTVMSELRKLIYDK